MNHPRFLALAVAALLASPLAAIAQTTPSDTAPMAPVTSAHQGHHGSAYMRALRSAGLTADQKAQIKGFRSSMKTAYASADPATRRTNAANLRHQIDGILTPAQRSQMQAQLTKPAPAK